MAKVMQDAKLIERIDDFLIYLTRQWRAIPEQAAEWDEWDEESKTDFTLDWPVCEDRLRQINRYAEQGILTPAQRMRYEELRQLVIKHRPILERMLQEDAA